MTSILAYVCSRYLALDPAYIPTIYVTIYLNFQSWVAHIFWHILWHAIWPFTILYKWDILSAICQRLIFWQTFRHIIWQWYFDISDIYLGFWMTDVSHMYGIYSDTSSDIRCDILSDIVFWHFISHSVRALRGPKSLRAHENLWVRQGPETLRPSPGREKSEITSHRPPSCHIMVVKFSIFLLVKVSNLNFSVGNFQQNPTSLLTLFPQPPARNTRRRFIRGTKDLAKGDSCGDAMSPPMSRFCGLERKQTYAPAVEKQLVFVACMFSPFGGKFLWDFRLQTVEYRDVFVGVPLHHKHRSWPF